MNDSRLKIIVCGMVANYPVGGVAWDYMQYVIGLARLGHEVYYHEDTWSWPYDPIQNAFSASGEYSARFLRDFFRAYAPDLSEHWHYNHLHEDSFGMSRQAFDEVAKSADLFINVSGASLIPVALREDCIKVFLDTDPGYNQIILEERPTWSGNVDRWCDEVSNHDLHFTYAENINSSDCGVPLAGYQWRTTRMPVVLDLWKSLSPAVERAPWTTVMTWNDFKGKLTYKGCEFKSKEAEFAKILHLPSKVPVTLLIAAGGKDIPQGRLADNHWQIVDGPQTTQTPQTYQDFIVQSRGEISIAKNVYVALRTGWFSCRTACYLAAGRPAVVQDTGFSKFIPTDAGLFCFSDLPGAVDGICQVENDYERHQQAAVEVAAQYFDASVVLIKLLKDIGL